MSTQSMFIRVVIGILFSCLAFAGPVEDAQKLIEEGKYEEVDKVLESELSKQQPSAEAIRLSLAAAEALGRYVTANQRIGRLLLLAGDEKDAALLLRAARIADRMGNSQLALSRYFQYTEMRKDKSPELEEALRYLLRYGDYPDQFQRYLSLYGANDGTWRVGYQLMRTLIDEADAESALNIARTLLEAFPQDDRIYDVHGALRYGADNFLLGRGDDRYLPALRVMATAQCRNFGHIGHVYRHADSLLTAQERVEILLDIQGNIQHPMDWTPLNYLSNMRNLETDQMKVDAGRRFLAFEPLFRDSKNRTDYYYYMRVLIENPHVFHIDDKQLIDDQGMVARMDILFKKYEDVGPDALDHHVRHVLAYYLPKESAARLPFLKNNLSRLWVSPFEYLVRETEGKEVTAQYKAWSQGKSFHEQRAMLGHLMPLLASYKEKALLTEATRVYLYSNPHTFNRDHANAYFFNQNDLFTPEERLALLSQFIKDAGVTTRLLDLFAAMDKNKVWEENEAYKTLKEGAAEERQGEDIYFNAYLDIYKLPGDERDAAASVVERLLTNHEGAIPGGPEQCSTVQDFLLLETVWRLVSMSWSHHDSMRQAGELLLPRMAVGERSASLVRRLREHRIEDLVYTHAPTFAAHLKAADPSYEDNLWWDLVHARNPEGELSPRFPEDMWPVMGGERVFRYLMHNWSVWDSDRAAYNQLAAKVVALPSFKPTDRGLIETGIDRFYHASSATNPIPIPLVQKLWTVYLGFETESERFNPYRQAQILGIYQRSGHTEQATAFFNELQQLAAKRSPADAFSTLANIIQVAGLPMEEPGPLMPRHRAEFAATALQQAAAKLGPGDPFLYALNVPENGVGTVVTVATDEKWPEEARQAAQTASETYMQMLTSGGQPWGYFHNQFRLSTMRVTQLIEEKDWDRIAQILTWYARYLKNNGNWDSNYHSWILPLHEKLEDVGAHELAFIFIDTIEREGEPSDEIRKQLSILKAKASQFMLGVVTVNKNDPTYALQRAAFEYALGNEAKAWDLTSSKLNLLPEVWQSLDQLYISWAIEQMRKQKMLDFALKFAFMVLLQENDLDTEVAASVSLTKGDIYRDMENYQAARIEYRALMNNRRYRPTEAGFLAQFRLIELLIITKDYTTAEQNLERLVNLEDIRIQAEAYYLYARMMFEQGEYKLAGDYLKQVKDRVVNHVEAAFLQGELNLRTPGGLQHTEVPVGNPRLSTVAIPGRDLTLKLQDSNLAIAREKGAIPVIVRTSKGGDEEHVKLLPSPTNRNLFSGVIATALGEAQPNNLRLELVGDDIVSYIIDPEFQKANDIDYPPKELVVKSDARLVASSGEILSEEEEEQREMQRRMMETRAPNQRESFYFRNPNTIRPGNPIHVQVRDYDRDLGPEQDIVTVDLRTSSGDVLEGFELKETGPHTGIFRGAVPTGIPFPKAIVSDTREDRDPSVMINSGKAGAWTSLSDGKKPKWVEVDTMSSHEVSELFLEMPDTSVVRRLTLQGMLSEDYQPLATIPETRESGGMGLWAEYFQGVELKQLVESRREPFVAFDWRKGGSKLAAELETDKMSIRFTGSVQAQYDEIYTFYIYANDGIRLWLGDELVVDEWRNSGHRERTAEMELKAGQKLPIKIEYYDNGGNGRLYLSWSSKSLEKERIPQDQLFLPEGAVEERPNLPVQVTMAYNQNGHQPERMQRYLQVAPTATWNIESLDFERSRSPWPRQSWYTMMMKSTFYLPENQTLELRFAHQPPPHRWQWAYLYVNGELLIQGYTDENTIQRTARVQLTEGVHSIRVISRDHWGNSGMTVHYRQDDGNFAPLPADWFDPGIHPKLAEYLKPAAKLEVTENRYSATLLNPRRLRRVRWVFEDFTSSDITVNRVGIVGADGQTIVPGEHDFTSATTNDTLEIAPGDSITITYQDERRLREDMPELTEDLNSQYFNGTIMLANEEFYNDVNDHRMVRYQPAKRCVIGDQVTVYIEEYDADVSDKRDVIDVLVTTSSGESLTIQALETMPNYDGDWHNHAGRFIGILKIGEQTGRDTIAVKSGDTITATYLDKENTKPGIPIERSYSMNEGGESKPEFTIYRTRMTMVEDKRAEAQARLERLRKQYEDAVILREEIVARHPEYKGGDESASPAMLDGKPVIDVNGPLVFEVNYPKMARHSGSELELQVVAESELQAAAREGREPAVLTMPTHIMSIDELARVKGYPLRLESHLRRDQRQMLGEGSFAGVLRLQVGSPGDTIDDLVVSGEKAFATDEQREYDQDGFSYRVPTIIVSGSDTIHLRLIDQGTQVAEQLVTLRADARLELLERTYTIQKPAIYLGESFYVKITDPDRDVSDRQDEVELTVASASGDSVTIKLTETLPHSGIFTGSIEPQFLGEAKEGQPAPTPNLDDDVLQVAFGDEVVFTYTDPLPLTRTEPLEVTAEGLVHYGSDAQLASFSKTFKDSEMAVKTRFLMAEALFEMAKQKRKLEQPEQADEHIGQGKRILEEAMRDYPNTSLASQGEYLLANLAQELENYQEAIGRYSHVIRTWPESEFAAKSQFKKALCLEKLENYDQACEEYVRLTYIYPDSSLVADAIIRLATYYYQQEQFSIAGKIFANFQQRNPTHDMAPKSLFLAAQCHIKQKSYLEAADMLERLIDQYQDEKDLRAEGMYWLGDCHYQERDYVTSYQTFKKLTWDYPESKWAKYARGRLTDEQMIRVAEKED